MSKQSADTSIIQLGFSDYVELLFKNALRDPNINALYREYKIDDDFFGNTDEGYGNNIYRCINKIINSSFGPLDLTSFTAFIDVLIEDGKLDESEESEDIAKLTASFYDNQPINQQAYILSTLKDFVLRRQTLTLITNFKGSDAPSSKFISDLNNLTTRVELVGFKSNRTEDNARSLTDYLTLPAVDPHELIKDRFLCKGSGLLLVGSTGIGKSSIAMQSMILWALGLPSFGLEPVRPLKCCLIQAENDAADIRMEISGIIQGLSLTPEQVELASKSINIIPSDSHTGIDFLTKIVTPALKEYAPDVLFIDPVLSYLGGNVSDQEIVGPWLRNQLNPLLHKFNCGVVLVHHTKKTNSEDLVTDQRYAAMGSVEWSNWARAIITITPHKNLEGYFTMKAPKRGNQLHWKDEAGNFTNVKYLAHSKNPDCIYWTETTKSCIGEAKDLVSNKGSDDILRLMPAYGFMEKKTLIKLGQERGIGKHKADIVITSLLADGRLVETKATRQGKKAAILLGTIGREPTPIEKFNISKEGHYSYINN